MPPCGCGGNTGNVTWIFTNTKGVQTTYNTEVEAKAAKIRAGGDGSIRAVMRK